MLAQERERVVLFPKNESKMGKEIEKKLRWWIFSIFKGDMESPMSVGYEGGTVSVGQK